MIKRFITLLVLVIFPSLAFASQSAWMAENFSNSSNAANSFASPFGADIGTTPASNHTLVLPASGNFSHLLVSVTAAPGTGKSYAYTLYANGSATSLTCTISDTNTSCSDTTDSASVSAGDYVYFQETPSGTPTVSMPAFAMYFNGSTSKESVLSSNTSTNISGSSTNYWCVGTGYCGTSQINATNYKAVMPAAGTIKKLYVRFPTSTAPGNVTITVYKNGSSTALTCAVSSGTTCSDTSDSFSVSQGDYLGVVTTVSGSPTASFMEYSMVFSATTEGNFPLIMSNGINNMNGTTDYVNFPSATGWEAGSIYNQFYPAMTFQNITWITGASPSPGTREYTVTSGTGLTAGATATAIDTTTSSGTSGNFSASVITSDNSWYSFREIATSSPAVTWVNVAILGYIAPQVNHGVSRFLK